MVVDGSRKRPCQLTSSPRQMAILLWRGRRMPSKQRQRAAVALPKGVHRVTSRGREFFYFQAGRGTSAPGPRVRLPNDPHAPEFWRALRDSPGIIRHVEPTNTVSAAIHGYLASAATTVGEDTLYNYRGSLSIARQAWGELPIAGLRPAHVLKVMEGLAATPGKANNFLPTMKLLSGWANTGSNRQEHSGRGEALQAYGRSPAMDARADRRRRTHA